LDENEQDDELTTICTAIQDILNSFKDNDHYPIGVTDLNVRRPTISERYWGAKLLVGLGCLFLGNTVYISYQNGTLLHISKQIYRRLSDTILEHIVEPVINLTMQLFETIRRRKVGIVTREDLEQSQLALERMLEDFSKTNKGSTLLYPLTKYLHDISGSTGGMISEGESNQSSQYSSEEIMEELMKSYENEMKTPITGLYVSLIVYTTITI
jgi:hypothetical protein